MDSPMIQMNQNKILQIPIKVKTARNILLLVLLVVAQTFFSVAQENPATVLDSMIMKYTHAKDLKKASFDELDCTYNLEFKNRTIKLNLPNVSGKAIQWKVQKDDLILILASSHKQKAFFECRSKQKTENFETLWIHFNVRKSEDNPSFRNVIVESIKQLVNQCANTKMN